MPRKPDLSLVTDAAPIQPTTDTAPSAHTTHAVVYENETKLRLAAFESGIVTLTGEMESRNEEFGDKIETLKIEFEQATAKLTQEFNAEKADLLRRINDMQRGKRMACAALDAFSEAENGN